METSGDEAASCNGPGPDPARLVRLGMAQGAVVLAAGLNLRFVAVPVGAAPLMMWHHMISMLLITPLALALAFLILHELERGRADARRVLALFLFSSAWVAVAMGVHEPINQLQIKLGLLGDLSPAGQTMTFLDEIISHWVLFAGYAGLCLAWAWGQARNPLDRPLKGWIWAAFYLAGVCGAAGMVAALWKDSWPGIIRELAVLAAVIVGCELFRRHGGPRRRQPLTVCLQLSNALAFAVLLVKGLIK